jgi:hypothetical protein
VSDITDPLAALETMIADVEAQEAPAPAAEATNATPEAPPPVVAEAAPAATPPAEPPPEPAPDRASERLASRMKMIEERERALEEKEKTYRTIRSKLLRGDIQAFKDLGFSDAEIPSVVRVAMASQLPPDKVPDQYRALKEKMELEDRFHQQQEEVQRLRNEISQREAREAQAREVAAYEAEVGKYLEAPADAPTLARLPKDKARARIMAAVQKDAADKIARIQAGELDPATVRPMSPAEAAKVVEAELAEYASIFAPSQDSTTAPKTAPRVTLANRANPPATGRPQVADLDPDPLARVDDWLKQAGLK